MIARRKERNQPASPQLRGTRQESGHSEVKKACVDMDIESHNLINTPAYISSPIKTLVTSTTLTSRISTHDLLDAYHIFALRLKTLAVSISKSSNVAISATLEPLKANSPRLLEALNRDIRRALTNPFPSINPFSPSLEFSPEWRASIPHNASQTRAVDLTPDDVQRVSESVMICHCALRLVSVIFRFEGLYQMFQVQGLDTLVRSVLALLPKSHEEALIELPTPNSRKTRAIALWVLGVQRLPTAVTDKDEVTSGLCGCIKAALAEGEREEETVVADALKAYKCVIESNIASIEALHVVLPNILARIVSPSWELRYRAADVLTALSVAFLAGGTRSDRGLRTIYKGADPAVWDTIALNIRSFMDTQCSGRATTQSETRLSGILSAALSKSPGTTNTSIITNKSMATTQRKLPTLPARWALQTLHSLLILSTSRQCSLYLHPRSLKFFVTLFGRALISGRKDVRRGGEDGWKGLVWAFGRLYISDAHMREREGKKDDVKHKAFKVVKQELGAGIGSALVATLLAMEEDGVGVDEFHENTGEAGRCVGMALEVVSDMIAGESKSTAKEGIEVLVRLVSGIGCSASHSASFPAPHKTILAIPHSLVDESMLDGGLHYENPRLLTEFEISQSWDGLTHLLIEGVERYLQDGPTEETEVRRVTAGRLIQIWQSLLLVQAQFTQGHGHLTTPMDFADRAISLVSGFLKPVQAAPPTFVPSPCPRAQCDRLTFVSKLWRVMRNVFAASWLSMPAARILEKTLSVKWLLGDDGVMTAWAALTSELVGVGWSILFGNMGNDDKRISHYDGKINDANKHGSMTVQRQLWSILALNWKSDINISWQDLAKFLGIPFGRWVMNTGEMQLWDGKLGYAISAADSTGPACVVEHILLQLTQEKMAKSSLFTNLVDTLLLHLHFPVANILPTSLLTIICNILRELYPPQPEALPSCLKLLCTVKDIIITAPATLLTPLLAIIQTGLNVWIIDKEEAVPEKEYNNVITSLYSDTLAKLADLQLSTSLLQNLGAFLASGFERVPPPAICPLAFQTFWKATFHEKHEFLRSLPPEIKDCLRAFDDAFGRDLAVGLSHGTDSQSTFGSSIPDSETSRPLGDHAVMDHGSQQSTPRAIANAPPQYLGRAFLSPSLVAFRRQEVASASLNFPGLGTLTPAPSPELQLLVSTRSASSQLKNYSGHNEDNNEPTSVSIRPQRSQRSPPPRPLKRPTDSIEHTASKRSKTEPKLPATSSTVNTGRLWSITANRPKSIVHDASRAVQRDGLGVVSEPTSRVMSPVIFIRTPSEPAPRKKMVFDGVQVPTLRQLINSQAHRSPPVVPVPRDHVPDSPVPSSEDFDSWEAGLSLSELRSLQFGSVDSEFSEMPDTEMDDTSDAKTASSFSFKLPFSDLCVSPSISPTVPPRRGQSQSLPHVSPLQAPRLRRARTTAEKLDALKEAYKDVAGELSQMRGDELLQVVRLGNSVVATASEKLRPHLANWS